MVDVEIPKVQEDRVYLSAKKHVGIKEPCRNDSLTHL